MKTFLRYLIAPAAALCLLGSAPLSAGESEAKDPKTVLEESIKALRANDVDALIKAASPDPAGVAKDWDLLRQEESDPDEDAMVNMQMAMLMNPEMNEMTIAQSRAQVAELPTPAELAEQIAQVEAFMPMIASQPPLSEASELPFVKNLLPDLRKWIAASAYNDPDKAEASTRALLEGLQALEIRSVEDLRALDFPALTDKLSKALVATKESFAVYGMDIDSFLDSITISSEESSGVERKLSISMELLGKPRTLNTTMVLDEGTWTPKLVRDLMPMLMGTMLGGPGPGGGFDDGFEDGFEDGFDDFEAEEE